MLKISYAGCLGLYLAISSQLTLKMCTAAKNCEKIPKNPSFRGSRSFKIIDVDKSKNPTTSACYDNAASLYHLQYVPIVEVERKQLKTCFFLSNADSRMATVL